MRTTFPTELGRMFTRDADGAAFDSSVVPLAPGLPPVPYESVSGVTHSLEQAGPTRLGLAVAEAGSSQPKQHIGGSPNDPEDDLLAGTALTGPYDRPMHARVTETGTVPGKRSRR